MKKLFTLLLTCMLIMPALFAQISNTQTTITLNSISFLPSQVCPWNNVPSSSAGNVYKMYVLYEDGDNFGVLKRLPSADPTTFYNCTVTNTPGPDGPNIFIDVPGATFPTIPTTSEHFEFADTKGTVGLVNTTTNTSYTQKWEYTQYVCPALPIYIAYFRLDPNYYYGNTGVSFLKFDFEAVDESNYLSHYILQRSFNNFTWTDEVLEPAQTGAGLHDYSLYTNKPGYPWTWYRLKWIGEYGFAGYSSSFQLPTIATSPATNIICNYTNITGPATACAPQSAVYKLHNAPASGAAYNWSASGATINSVSQANLTANVTFNWAGNATLYANAANSSCNKTKTVSVGGAGSTNIQTTSTTIFTSYTQYGVSVNILPGTTASQYSWYRNGTFIGTGQTQTVYVYSPNCDLYEVKVNTSCGEVVASRYLCYQSPPPPPPNPCDPPPLPRISPVPAKDKLTISFYKPICPMLPPSKMAVTLAHLYTIQLYDMYGNLKLERRNVSMKTDQELDIRKLPAGNYILFMKNAENTIRKQIRIEK